jgi:hypothetical protein
MKFRDEHPAIERLIPWAPQNPRSFRPRGSTPLASLRARGPSSPWLRKGVPVDESAALSRPQPPKGGRCPYYEHISEGSISACGHRLSSPCSEPAAGGPTPTDCSSSAAHPGVAFACGQEMPFLSKCPGRSELCSRLACPCNELHCGQHNRYAIQGQLADQGSAVARAGRIRTTSRAG